MEEEFKPQIPSSKKIYLIMGIAFALFLFVIGTIIYFSPDKKQTIQEEPVSYPYKVQTQYGLLEKNYQPTEEKVTLTREDQTTLSEIKLITPKIYKVGAGYQKVAEIEFTSYEDFKQYLSNSYFELYNKNDGMKPIQRQLDFKYLTTEQVSVDDYSENCITITNETGTGEKCTQVKSGSHLENKESWKDISEYVFKSGGKVKIGVFTDVQIDDNVEWIPTIYNVRIEEWAAWVEGLTTYTNPTLPNTNEGSTGKEGERIKSIGGDINLTYIYKVSSTDVTKCYVFNVWGGTQLASGNYVGDKCELNYVLTNNTNYDILSDKAGAGYTSAYNNGATKPVTTGNLIWVIGVNQAGATSVTYSRTITNITFWKEPVVNISININLISPANNTNFTTKTNYFVANVNKTGAISIVNVSLLINGTIDQTNTSGLVGAYNFSKTLPDGRYNWTIQAYGNNSIKYNALNGTLFFNISKIYIKSESYTSPISEAVSTSISANFLTNGTDISSAILTYNGTNYTGTINNHGSNNFTVTRVITTPIVAADTNFSFNWFISQGVFTTITNSNNQTVLNFAVDNCSVNSITLYNFTIRDETSQFILNGTSNNTLGKVDLNIRFGANQVATFNSSYTQTNPFRVCIGTALTSGETYNVTFIVQYGANGYQTEFYNIENHLINSSSLYNNISLFDLSSSVAQSFTIIVRDSSFLALQGGLIEIWRKYIDEGTFKIVEIPKTDATGKTIGNLVINDVIYNFIVKKNGATIGTFNNVRAVCQIPLVQSCEIDLNAFAESVTLPDFEEAEDFSFTLGYNNLTRVVSSVFSIPSGITSTISLNVTKEDALGTSVCSDILMSSSGTLSCTVPASFGNSTIRAELYKSNSLQAQGSIKLNQNPFDIYGVTLVGLSIFLMITLIGVGISNSPVITTLFLMVGVVLLFSLNLVANSGFIGATATVLWLFIALVIVLIKGVKRN